MKHCLWALALVALPSGCEKNGAQGAARAMETGATNVAPIAYHLDHAQPKLRTLKVWLGPHEIEAEVAVSLTEVSTGMMFRTNLAENAGMLFLFAQPQPRQFYMKNCLVSLSAAYIDAQGAIDEIVDLHAGVEKPVPSRSQQIQYVLEVPQGWFTRHPVKTGMVLNTSEGPLRSLRGVLP
jgi:uncharacterized membrane protein (UPF0127 family)